MAAHTVTKPFTTPTRRFAAGQPVTDADLDGPLTLADRAHLGQIAAPEPEPAVEPEAEPKPVKSGKGKAASETDPTT